MPIQPVNTPAFSARLRVVASALALGTALIAGCAIYKPEVIQGNFVSREQAAQLQRGMPRAVVSQVLGTPLLTDMFRADRWDYVFSIKDRKGVKPQKYALALFFEGDALARVEGAETLPSEVDFVKQIGGTRTYKPRNLQAAPATLETFAAQNRPKYVPAPVPTAPSTTSYPALPQ